MSLTGPQFRTDILTGQQVIVAPLRSGRPSACLPDPELTRSPDPFAEGNECDTPNERFAIRSEQSLPNEPGWKMRIVPNRYPAVSPLADQILAVCPEDENQEMFPWRPAIGEHDVVIECPDSRTRMVDLSPSEIHRTLAAWRTRFQQLQSVPSIRSVSIFRNEGFSAGASLAHCHSQILAMTELTPLDIARHERAQRHRQDSGRDMVQNLWIAERVAAVRWIQETANFGVYCPFASRTAWQMRFVPKLSTPEFFSDATDHVLAELAAQLKSSLKALELVLGGPFSFNLLLSHARIDQPAAFSWFLDLLPRTGRIAGWELLTGVDIVTVAPEVAAEKIRAQWSPA